MKEKHIDMQYKDMIVRIYYKGINMRFEIVEGEGSLSPDDKIDIMKLIGGYNNG